MKLKLLISLSAIAFAGVSSAATVLMDYDDGLVNGVHDANIQSGDVGVQDWVTLPGTGSLQYSSTNNSGIGSNQNLVLGSNRTAAHDLNYTASLGDVFEASYMWRAASGWEEAVDRITFSLYYTDDNLIDGNRTLLFTYESVDPHTSTYSTDIVPDHVLSDAGADGKKIFVLLADNETAGSNQFARVDNIYVGVTPVPEPSSAALLGLGAAGLLLRRRRA